MALQGTDERWTEIRKIHLDHKLFYHLGGGLLLVLVGVFIGAKLFAGDSGYFTNLYTEVLSIAVTIIVLNRLAQNREERREIKAEQQRLIRAAGSTVNDVAKNAIDEIRKRGWLRGETGILKGSNLWSANLQGANLERANLQDADLKDANLQGAHLLATNLRDADFRDANLQGANLMYVNLQGAYLLATNLRDAYLSNANLRGANLLFANLQDANLDQAIFDETTTLPDGNKWISEIKLTRFTDPKHLNFWRSDYYPLSPFYRGETQDADTSPT